MTRCHFTLKLRKKCGKATEGQKQQCEDHRNTSCSVCKKSAWVECQSADCDAVLCRSPVCKAKHEHKAHPEGIEHPEAAPVDPEAQQEALDTIPVDALPCPACEGEVHAEIRRKIEGKDHRKKFYQVVCSKCCVAGPVAQSVVLAVRGWDRLPRGRPAVYEGIRARGLALIDGALVVYEKDFSKEGLDPEDCVAIAKMLEAATMAVDTWEM